uniref:Uncharacterized protein n=1 Tax=Arundo donax TaxID=35708 RepID=A0A0A8ZN99_ARUDO
MVYAVEAEPVADEGA